MDLLSEAVRVAHGEIPPAHTRDEYESEMATLVAEEASEIGEDYAVAYALLCAKRDPRLDCLYKAAGIATLWDDLRANSAGWEELAIREPIRFELSYRRDTWRRILRIAKRIKRSDENMRAAMERLLRTDYAARCAYSLCLQETS